MFHLDVITRFSKSYEVYVWRKSSVCLQLSPKDMFKMWMLSANVTGADERMFMVSGVRVRVGIRSSICMRRAAVVTMLAHNRHPSS